MAARRLLRPYPGVVVLSERMDEWRTRALAAVYGTDGVLSHTSASTVWQVAVEHTPVHVSVPASRRALRRPGLTVHRVQDVSIDRLGPYPVTRLPRSLVDAWRPRLVELARGVVITTLRERQVGVGQPTAELTRHPAMPGRAALRELVAAGCQSELEIWGVRHVLRAPEMPRFVEQYPVGLPFDTVHLDAAIPDLRIAIEMDGAAFHGSPEARESDTRRDVASRCGDGWSCGSATGG